MLDNPTRDSLTKRLEKAREFIATFQQEEAQAMAELGLTGAAATMAQAYREEDEREAVFDRMTPAERTQLFMTNREEWDRVIAAKEAAGFRKLIFKR